MTDKEKISWRQQAKLWVLQGILLVAAGISLFSTMAGFHTVFFPSSAMVGSNLSSIALKTSTERSRSAGQYLLLTPYLIPRFKPLPLSARRAANRRLPLIFCAFMRQC